MYATRPDPDAYLMPTPSSRLQRRINLTEAADTAIHRSILLFSRSPESASLVRDIRTSASELRGLCGQSGSEGEDKAAIVCCAEHVLSLVQQLATADPKMSDYYVGPITSSVIGLLRELRAPLGKGA